jgi:hypothetical protein
VIKKATEKGKTVYKVLSESGKHMGTYAKEEDAKKRLQQVEFFKRVASGKIKVPAAKRGKSLKRLMARKKRKS